VLLLHACAVCPNLECLCLGFNWRFNWRLSENDPLDPDRLNRHIEQVEPLINWALDELLPQITEDCRFRLGLRLDCIGVPKVGCFD